MEIKSIDAQLFAKMFLAGAGRLEANKEWINELNVFPVPDGDTGTNMTMTITSAAAEVSKLSEYTMENVAKAVSSGSLRGARGNSGVILSQLLRGFSKVVSNYDVIDSIVLANAFQKAVETAYKAVMKPKEGTILTVARGAAEEAVELAEKEDDLVKIIEGVIAKAEEVLAQTPEMLSVLKQAGVVDSGGQGLVEVLKGCFDALTGKAVDYKPMAATGAGPALSASRPPREDIDTANIKFGYCTEFIIMLDKMFDEDAEAAFKKFLLSIGDSLVLVADDEIVKVHVHTNDPGLAIQKALTFGALSNMKIDNMRLEHEEKLIKDASKIAAQEAQKEAAIKEDEAIRAKTNVHKNMAFVAVSAGEGLDEIFNALGVDVIIKGGQTMNPSTQDFLNAVESINADTIFILPNNSNIILAANQVKSMVEDKNIIVIPTKTIPQGIMALINYIADRSPEENEEQMLEEIGNIKTGQVTYAVRDTEIYDIKVSKDDYMGVGDSTILCVGKELEPTVLEMIDKMVDDDSSLISIYYGEEISKEDAQSLTEKAEEQFGDCDIELHFGGQPIYYYIVSVE
ncbi:MAG: DAK2 domain-containing protein [Lachnospiraceae bacterium]|nr:DAK2 domain-containing protein [Lachnospiraceae bacterium]